MKLVRSTDEVLAAIGNAVLVFITFLASVPAIVLPMTRGWLKLHGYMTVVCSIYTLVLGLSIWFQTLRTRSNLFKVWTSQSASTQSLIQQEVYSRPSYYVMISAYLVQFTCCGYMNSTTPPFVVDSVCTNSVVAANLGGCVSPFASFGNNFLDLVFTAAFGIVGVSPNLAR